MQIVDRHCAFSILESLKYKAIDAAAVYIFLTFDAAAGTIISALLFLVRLHIVIDIRKNVFTLFKIYHYGYGKLNFKDGLNLRVPCLPPIPKQHVKLSYISYIHISTYCNDFLNNKLLFYILVGWGW